MAGASTMSNYALGPLLGKGASAQVYQAVHVHTGETVAIKSISLNSLSPSAQSDIMSEIDLLKNLNHPNIVKYKGFARDKENLFIVLEYCENGSLQTFRKKFEKFPESLLAAYIYQVLEGLVYLHEQGVIHRDIKGANLLTNKDGRVKLADFGVSTKKVAGALLDENENHEVVGSPYWMAPEVIEQSGATTASDIWSVGCVVVELLEGKPPYGDLAPMQALWRIVQDESMSIPAGASSVVKDFLYQCFQKDPNLRITAKALLRHPWMLAARKSLELAPSLETRARNPSSIPMTTSSSSLRSSTSGSRLVPRVRGSDSTIKARRTPGHAEAVQQAKAFNDAVKASPHISATDRIVLSNSSTRPSIPCRSDRHVAPLELLTGGTRASHSNGDVPGRVSLSMKQNEGLPSRSLLERNLHYQEIRDRTQETDDKPWDEDFALDKSVPQLQAVASLGHVQLRKRLKRDDFAVDDANQKTLRASKSPVPSSSGRAFTSRSTKPVDDYSDIGSTTAAAALEAKFAHLKLRNKSRRSGELPAFVHPDQLAKARSIGKLSTSTSSNTSDAMAPSPVPTRSLPTLSSSRPGTAQVQARSKLSASPSLTTLDAPPSSSRASLNSRLSSVSVSAGNASATAKDLKKYAEKDEDDYDDVFGDSPGVSLKSLKRQSLQLTKRSNRSWGSNEDEWNDPFAEIEDDLAFGEEDTEAQLLRENKATLCSKISSNLEVLDPTSSSATLRAACDELLVLFTASPDMRLEAHFVSCHGMLAWVVEPSGVTDRSILELLELRLSRDIVVRLLRIVNWVVMVEIDALESFCLIGGIPVIIPFTSKKHSLESRLEASKFIKALTKSALTLQMFISCRGLRILVEMLDEDYSENKSLVLSSLEGVESVFDLQSPTPRNDFCRMFIREGVLDPLSTALLAILQDDNDDKEEHASRAVHVLLMLCQCAQADARVREAFATRMIMSRLLKACTSLPRKLLLVAIKSIKHLSTSAQLIEVLQNSNALEILIGLLGDCLKGAQTNEICSYILQTVYSMTRLSKTRQEEASSSGIIPLLKKIIVNKSLLKQFALPILCDVANAGKVSRRLLWQHDGMKLYLNLLDDEYWRVSAIDAILAWMSDETARVEDVLVQKEASECLVKAFVQATGVSFEGILDPLLKILRLSTSLTSSISSTPFIQRLSQALSQNHKAVVKLNLLRLTRVVFDSHPERDTLVSRFDLDKIVDKLAKQDEAILVRELAKEVYPTLLSGSQSSLPQASVLNIDDGPEVPKQSFRPMERSSLENLQGTAGATDTRADVDKVDVHDSALSRGAKQDEHDGRQHRRKISRGQIKNMQCRFDENERPRDRVERV